MLFKDFKIFILDGVGLIVCNFMIIWGYVIYVLEWLNYILGYVFVFLECLWWDFVLFVFEKYKGNYGGKYFKKYGCFGVVYFELNVMFLCDFGDLRVV